MNSADSGLKRIKKGLVNRVLGENVCVHVPEASHHGRHCREVPLLLHIHAEGSPGAPRQHRPQTVFLF